MNTPKGMIKVMTTKAVPDITIHKRYSHSMAREYACFIGSFFQIKTWLAF
jgi:hypothetical protein